MAHRKPGDEYNVDYRDTGCEFAPSCLNCPFPYCMEDELKRGGQIKRVASKLERISSLVREGRTQTAIASELDINVRTVRRALIKLSRGAIA